MDFYEKAVHYSELIIDKTIHFTKNNKANFIVFIMLLVGINMSNRVSIVVQNNKLFDNIVRELEESEGIKIESITPDSSYETHKGIMDSSRLVSKDAVYNVYIENQNHEQPYIWNDTNKEWVLSSLDIPPIISKAFIYYNIGIVDEYNDGVAIVENEQYTLKLKNNRLHIDNVGVYAPLPPQANRVTQFIEDYISADFSDLKFISGILKEDKEIIYAELDEEVYSIHIHYNGSVEIGIVSQGKEEIRKNLSF